MAGWTDNPVLTVEHLTMRFGGLLAVNDLSFTVGRNDVTALIGPNGAGKTTVFNCLTGFYKPTEGRIEMRRAGGESFLLERMDDFRISRHARVARTFQNIRLFAGMTVLENLVVAQHNPLMQASRFTFAGLFGLAGYREAEKAAVDKARYWLDKVRLTERADDPAGDLPYGAQRRLEIARAMCTEPELLCLDEPAAGLNPRESEELNALLLYIRREHGIGVLLIEHDMSVVMEISDHVVVLDYGEKISDGTAAEVRADPSVIRAYLGVEEDEEAPEVVALVSEAVPGSEGDETAAAALAALTGKKDEAGGAKAKKRARKTPAAAKAKPAKAAAKAKPARAAAKATKRPPAAKPPARTRKRGRP